MSLPVMPEMNRNEYHSLFIPIDFSGTPNPIADLQPCYNFTTLINHIIAIATLYVSNYNFIIENTE